MRGRTGVGRVLANVALAAAAAGLVWFVSTQVRRRQWRAQPTFAVAADFATIGGVDAGARVRLQGMDAGVVQAVVAPTTPGRPVRLVFRVDERLRPLVRADALARIMNDGIVGAKTVEIVPGRPDGRPLGPDGLILSERPTELADVLKKASISLDRLDAAVASAERGLGEANAVVAKVRRGEGTLGKLVQEDEAYRKMVGLSDRGERALHDLDENLAALKRTWPLSRYFNDRAFFDREQVLYHPGSERADRSFREDELFEPGRAILTATGRRRLDDAAAWFKRVKKPGSEVVIAAFTDQAGDPDLARLLTQEQAGAVRKYLVGRHSIDSAGWFSTRKVAAVGFGIEVPRAGIPAVEGQVPRRVDLLVFTPQA